MVPFSLKNLLRCWRDHPSSIARNTVASPSRGTTLAANTRRAEPGTSLITHMLYQMHH